MTASVEINNVEITSIGNITVVCSNCSNNAKDKVESMRFREYANIGKAFYEYITKYSDFDYGVLSVNRENAVLVY